MTVSTTASRKTYSGNGATVDFSFPYKFFEDGDLVVVLIDSSGTETTQVLNTDYTVSGEGTDSSGQVSMSTAPASGETLVIYRSLDLTQDVDYISGDAFPAETHEQALDRLTLIAQQLDSTKTRSVRLADSVADDPDLEITESVTERANKVISFDSTGDLQVTQELGVYQGTDATTTTAAYNERDLVKSTTTAQLNNIYICLQDSPSGTSLTNTSYWALVVDAVTAASSASSASGFADEAEEWATKVDGIVESTDYSSKAWSIGGTGVTTTSGKGAAKEWATSTGAAVDTSEYSAKEYAVGDLTASGGSAKAWAIDSSSPDGSSEKSAKTLAGEAATSASNAATSESNAADWAVKTDGIVDSTDYAAKAWSIGGTGVTTTASAGAAKEWATTTGGAVDTSEYSAKEYAKGDLTATGGSAKAWAIDSSSPDGGSDQSAKTNAGYSEEWANKAEDSLISTAAGGDGSTEYSARHWAAKAQASLDSIENFYLGASATAPTVDDNGDPLAAGDWYFNTTDNLTYIYNGSSWQVTVVSTSGLVSKTGDTMTGALILNSTDALTLPVGTDAQRPTPVKGMFRFNDDSDAFEGYDGAAWGAVGGGNTAVVGWENQITVAENYTITTNNNMMSAGPITIDTGYSVTIPTGSTWTIV